MSREYTKDEVREMFYSHIRSLINYWAVIKLDHTNDDTVKYRMEGLMHSFLNMLDGNTLDMPSFIVAPYPHEDDKQYHIDNNKDYFPENCNSNVECDIGGSLRYFQK